MLLTEAEATKRARSQEGQRTTPVQTSRSLVKPTRRGSRGGALSRLSLWNPVCSSADCQSRRTSTRHAREGRPVIRFSVTASTS